MSIEAPAAPRTSSPSGHRHTRRKRRLPTWIAVVGWIVLAPLALVAAMRLFAWDRYDYFAILNTVTLFVYLPAWIVAVVALIGRRFVLGAAALVIVVLQVVFLLPELTASESLPAWVKGAPTVRLLDANVYDGNPSMAGYESQIRQFRPQLVTMEEANPADALELSSSGALNGLPYRIEVRRFDSRAFLVASAYPMSGTHIVYFQGLPLVVQTTMHLASGSQPLWVVHTTAPTPSSFDGWKADVAEIDRLIRARGTDHLLVVGDFNSTWGNQGFRDILASGMTDGAAARGDPFGMTWSQTKPVFPPLVRIDHVLTGGGVAVTRIATAPGPGSDHRDLHAVIAFQE
jgi:endonuclease/exonuclease/phosphatase (EEP) superfamily protein YafD